MRFNTLDEWLSWQETLHPSEIELGLERVKSVFNNLYPHPVLPRVITVAGTNGKGSSVAMLAAIYAAAGYRVGCYSSPHISRYNERVVVDGKPVTDQALCQAFERVDQARGEISLTYFEFGTLAALDIFLQHELDAVILEVGLGGRLDAVNIIDADVALITAIGLDHVQWLGEDIESIAKEKAGIMRNGKAVVSSGSKAINTLADCAAQTGAQLYQIEQDFSYAITGNTGNQTWHWRSAYQQRTALPLPALFGEHQLANAAGVLMVVELLTDILPVSQAAVRQGLSSVQLAGRFQLIAGEPLIILDVAHNVDAMKQLAKQLQQHPSQGRSLAVLGMLSDKDIHQALAEVVSCFDEWFIARLPTARSASPESLEAALQSCNNIMPVQHYDTVRAAIQAAKRTAEKQDRIVVFGSFYTVAQAVPQPL